MGKTEESSSEYNTSAVLHHDESESIARSRRQSKWAYILIALLGCLLATALIIFVSKYNSVNRLMDEERQTYVFEVSDRIGSQIASTLNHLNSETAMLPAMLNSSDAKTFADCKQLFEGVISHGNVMLITDNGEVFDLDGKYTSFDDRDLFASVVFDKENTFSYESDSSHSDYWMFCYPCAERSIDGYAIVGILMAYPADNFASEFSMQLFGETGYALLCDDNGSIRLRPKQSDWIGFNIYTSLLSKGASDDVISQMENAFETGQQTDVSMTIDGSRWLLHCEKLSDESLGSLSNLVVIIPIEAITNQVSNGMRAAIYSALFVAITAALIILLLIITTRRNLAERKMQEQKIDMEIAVRSAEAKSDFLARMSHDIRTPLTAIIGLNYIAGQNLSNPEVLADCNKKLSASADYLLQILNDVLDMSKISSGKLEIAHNRFSMEEMLSSLSTMVEPRVSDKDLSFSMDAPKDFGEDFVGDRLRISQVLMNLLTNAVKFTPSGGRVTLSCSLESADAGKGAGAGASADAEKGAGAGTSSVRFVVSDTGIGMSDDYMKRLFTPFEQETAFIADQYGGSGLGLSIVNSLVSLMHGTVSVKSKQGEGSVFTVILPIETAVRTEERTEQAKDLPYPDVLEGKRVLLAEDNLINQQIAMSVLNSMGLEVDTADNGQIALDAFLAAPPNTYDLILTDIRMPVMDGYAFAEAVRKSGHPDAATIPMAALSANAFEEDIAESMKRGMNAHLRKPLEIDEIRTVLNRLLRDREASHPDTHGTV